MTLCGLVGQVSTFGGICCLHLQSISGYIPVKSRYLYFVIPHHIQKSRSHKGSSCFYRVASKPLDTRENVLNIMCQVTFCVTIYIYIYIYIYIQGVPGGMCQIRKGVPYVKVYQYNPKHLCPKFNGYGDNGQRKVWSSGGSTHCTCQLTALSMLRR